MKCVPSSSTRVSVPPRRLNRTARWPAPTVTSGLMILNSTSSRSSASHRSPRTLRPPGWSGPPASFLNVRSRVIEGLLLRLLRLRFAGRCGLRRRVRAGRLTDVHDGPAIRHDGLHVGGEAVDILVLHELRVLGERGGLHPDAGC